MKNNRNLTNLVEMNELADRYISRYTSFNRYIAFSYRVYLDTKLYDDTIDSTSMKCTIL
jgi:hypothetical protein